MNKNNAIGVFLVTVLGGALLIYTAFRNSDFISITFAGGNQIMAYFGLAAIDGGLVAWCLVYLHGAKGGKQRALSFLMVLVCLLAVIVTMAADTFLHSGQNGITGKVSGDTAATAIWFVVIVIGLNIVGTVLFHLYDPAHLKRQMEEEIEEEIDAQELKWMKENGKSLAAETAPIRAANWQANRRAQLLQGMIHPTVPALSQPYQVRNAHTPPAADGSVDYNFEANNRITELQSMPEMQLAQPHATAPKYDLDGLLQKAGMSREQAVDTLKKYGRTTPQGAYDGLKMMGKLPYGMTMKDFKPLFTELFT